MFFCGIDVAKRKHAVMILDEKGQTHTANFRSGQKKTSRV